MRYSNPMFAGQADEELVSLAQAGDNEAFAELLQRHLGTCRKLALSILRDREDAEDEVQNASWKAFEHINQFQKDAKFSTWLSRIVVNQCLMRLRKERRAKFLYLDDGVAGEDVATLDLADERPSPEQVWGKQEVAHVLKNEIRRIPPLLREVFMLRDVQQLSMPEVADQLGISVAAAKSRLLRARLELRSRLGKHCGRLGTVTLTA